MPVARDLTGCVLSGRYELKAVIGDGSFGRVYRARDRRLDRLVAVKAIKPWWTEDPEFAGSFEREARLLARLNDPGIVQIFDVGQADEGLYYVTELVDGESLASRLQRGRLAPPEAGDIAEQLCRALARAHSQRVVHRDVKPANILISSQGQVKLGDFGVARLAEGTTGLTHGSVVGTPKYMAPEQARGLPTTPATDVYSVGVVLYEMLAGEPPFAGVSVVDLALSHVQDPVRPLPEEIPPGLASVVYRSLAKEPARRFQDGREMAGALAGVRSSSAEHTTARMTVKRPVRAHAPAASARKRGADTLTATAVRPNGAAPPRRRVREHDATRMAPRPAPRRDARPDARRSRTRVLALAVLLAAIGLAAVVLAGGSSVHVPKLIGLTKSAASAKAHHLSLRPVFSARFDKARAGTAIAQSPAAGVSVDDGSAVRITLSRGPPPVKLPKLVGQDSGPAGRILHSLGMKVAISTVPAPGVQPGVVTGETPRGGTYVRAHAVVSLSVAETPRWRELTSFSGSGSGRSVPFRIRGDQWRVAYHMSYLGTCTFIVLCDGPTAQVLTLPSGSPQTEFGLSDGQPQTNVIHSGPGLYEITVTPGSDTAEWKLDVEDHY